jgi:CTP:molybdopterin cytidylyltransferase MocA
VPPTVAGVLLAAGSGSRLGRPKALVVIGGQTLAHRGIALLRAGGADPVIVVTGATGSGSVVGEEAGDPDGTNSAGAGPAGSGDGSQNPGGSEPGVLSVHNPDWQTGMGSSLAAGLGAVPGHCGAAVLALADQPLIGPEAVRRLLAAHSAGASVAVACYAGRPRNPVLISREHWPEVIALAVGDVGARPFLRAHPDLVTEVECGDTGQPDDVDSPADLARVQELLAGTSPFPA